MSTSVSQSEEQDPATAEQAGPVGSSVPLPKNPDDKREPAAPVDEMPLPDGAAPEGEDERPDPTRFGDWEINGRCIDF